MTYVRVNGQQMTVDAFMQMKGLSVGGSLDLFGCTALTSLPEGLSVGGSLDLRACTALTSLPKGLSVGGSLFLRGCTALANIIRGGTDKRGYAFYGARLRKGWRVVAGCRNFSAAEARRHWREGSECRALAEQVIAQFPT